MIEVHDLTKRYGEVTAVKGISFNAQPGQVTGFLGPNGAGKTTTMRILTGFLPPTSGRAVVAGYDVFENSMEVRKRVGYLPESVPLYRDMTARGYLMYIGEIRGLSNRRQRADEVLERVGLEHRANSRIRTLSKGMRQRVGLAQALIHDPQVLILDEPTIGLDPLQVLELRELVRELGHDHTVLFSTHILSEAEQVCDSVVIINQGTIIAQGSPSALRSQLERGGRVLVRVDAPVDEAAATVGSVPAIAHAESTVEGIIATPANPNVDPRPAIARAIIDKGWNLIELRALAVNLEEIFLELTRQETQAVGDETGDSVQAVAEPVTSEEVTQ
jgi:ABC-2 type transport system ATP-binding protein